MLIKKTKQIIITVIAIQTALVILYITSLYRWPSMGEYRGTFTPKFESMKFTPDWTITQSWWLREKEDSYWLCKGELKGIFEDMQLRDHNIATETPCYRIKVRGELSPYGKYGHLGMFRRELTVDKLMEYEHIGNNKDETGMILGHRLIIYFMSSFLFC